MSTPCSPAPALQHVGTMLSPFGVSQVMPAVGSFTPPKLACAVALGGEASNFPLSLASGGTEQALKTWRGSTAGSHLLLSQDM